MKKKGKPPVQKKQKGEVAFEKSMEPIQTKFGIKNILQGIVGAVILAIPIGFTEETWRLGETLPLGNIIIILILSLGLTGIFAYRNLSKHSPNFYWTNLTKRIFSNYLIAFLVVTLLLLIIQRAPWTTDGILAFKRTVIVALPSSLSATIASNLR
jgi:uncharacterized membrane protein